MYYIILYYIDIDFLTWYWLDIVYYILFTARDQNIYRMHRACAAFMAMRETTWTKLIGSYLIDFYDKILNCEQR